LGKSVALTKFGNVTFIREKIYRMNTIAFAETLWRDMRHAWRQFRQAIVANGQAETAFGEAVGGEYFHLLGVFAEIGRTLQPADDKPGAQPFGRARGLCVGAGARRIVRRALPCRRAPHLGDRRARCARRRPDSGTPSPSEN
jgi:hypothetical protein